MIPFLRNTIILQQMVPRAFSLENWRESSADEVWLFFCELIQKRSLVPMLVNLILRQLRGLNVILQQHFLLLNQFLFWVNWTRCFHCFFSLPDPPRVMWSAAATSKVNLIGGGQVGQFQFAIQNTRQIQSEGCIGSVSEISVQGEWNCFNVSTLAC